MAAALSALYALSLLLLPDRLKLSRSTAIWLASVGALFFLQLLPLGPLLFPVTHSWRMRHGVGGLWPGTADTWRTGYFERQGEVEADATIDLHFKAAEMNDVLKSLTTLDLDGGHVSSISYESTKPVEKQLEDIAIRLPDQNSLTGLLAQVKGARVAAEVGPRRVEGVVTGIESVARKEGQATLETHYLNLLVEGASIQSFDLLEVKSLAFLDEGLRKDLQRLLEILISAKKKDLKRLTIFGRGKGKRRLLASYTVETPVWKTSYRVLLGGPKAMIQGWALVDNTQDEDWESVSLTLVAGLPISFVHDLYSPRYKRRPVVRVQEEEAYAPPVLEAPSEKFEEMDAETAEEAVPASAAAPRGQLARFSKKEMAASTATGSGG